MNIADYQKELRRGENEVAFLHALRVFGRDLPKPEEEFRFAPTRDWRFDFAWAPYLVASEADGGQKCADGGRHNQDSDREKLNAAAALGWIVLRFSRQQIINNPEGCVDDVRKAIASRSKIKRKRKRRMLV